MTPMETTHDAASMRRAALVQVRLTERERQRWRAAAARSAMRLAEYVRDCVRAALRDEQRAPGSGDARG